MGHLLPTDPGSRSNDPIHAMRLHEWGTCEFSRGCCPSDRDLEKLFVTSK
jgi:hypothetical protein